MHCTLSNQFIDAKEFSEKPDHAGDKVLLRKRDEEVALLDLVQDGRNEPLEELVQARHLLLVESRPRQALQERVLERPPAKLSGLKINHSAPTDSCR